MAGRQLERTKSPPSLQSLCLGVVGKHLEDIIPDLSEIAINFPPDVKVSILIHKTHINFCVNLSFFFWGKNVLGCFMVNGFLFGCKIIHNFWSLKSFHLMMVDGTGGNC